MKIEKKNIIEYILFGRKKTSQVNLLVGVQCVYIEDIADTGIEENKCVAWARYKDAERAFLNKDIQLLCPTIPILYYDDGGRNFLFFLSHKAINIYIYTYCI